MATTLLITKKQITRHTRHCFFISQPHWLQDMASPIANKQITCMAVNPLLCIWLPRAKVVCTWPQLGHDSDQHVEPHLYLRSSSFIAPRRIHNVKRTPQWAPLAHVAVTGQLKTSRGSGELTPRNAFPIRHHSGGTSRSS